MSTVEVPARLRVGAESAGLTMSPEEFDAIEDYDEVFNYELIHGVLVVTPMASRSERSSNELLGHWLLTYGQHRSAGNCLIATLFEEYLRTSGNRRRADRVLWVAHGGRRPNPDTDVPTIVVEFVSAGKAAWQRDDVEKRDEYLHAGVVEYWVVDRFRRTLTAYIQQSGQIEERTIREAEVYRPALLPGFELPLVELLAAADRGGEPEHSRD